MKISFLDTKIQKSCIYLLVHKKVVIKNNYIVTEGNHIYPGFKSRVGGERRNQFTITAFLNLLTGKIKPCLFIYLLHL